MEVPWFTCNTMAGAQKAMFIDPEWSPTALVTRRLRDAGAIHASRLAERTTVESLLPRRGDGGRSVVPSYSVDDDDDEEEEDNDDDIAAAAEHHHHPLASAALMRSSCPQPPLDDAVTGGGSSAPCDVHFSGMNVRLDPLERCAPHRIVVPQTTTTTTTTSGGGGGVGWGGDPRYRASRGGGGVGGGIVVRGEVDGGTYDAGQRSATWNAITALSALCEEAHELDEAFRTRILPSIVLFGADDGTPPSDDGTESRRDILDEEVNGRRESALLARMGTFLPALQLASNGTSRVRRLMKNMVVQLGAVRIPSASAAAAPPSRDEQRRDGERREGVGGPYKCNDGDVRSASGTDDVAAPSGGRNGERGAAKVVDDGPPVFGPGTPMFRLGKAISVALRILVAVDAAVSSNADLQEAWSMYKDVVMDWSEQKRNVSFSSRMMRRFYSRQYFAFVLLLLRKSEAAHCEHPPPHARTTRSMASSNPSKG